ncbi:MAG: hypothetical protein JXB45_07260 [Candidatus Krumholzibacteriota bacterium]|nr:hypothetical protein [Candidatus Krumholzibacteriota bacterium]
MKIRQNLQQRIGQASRSESSELNRLKRASRDFESVFISQFFKLMHTTVGNDGVLKRSFSRQIYEEMIQDEFAKAFTARGGFKLQDILIEKFQDSVKKNGSESARNERSSRKLNRIKNNAPESGKGRKPGATGFMKITERERVDPEFKPLVTPRPVNGTIKPNEER